MKYIFFCLGITSALFAASLDACHGLGKRKIDTQSSSLNVPICIPLDLSLLGEALTGTPESKTSSEATNTAPIARPGAPAPSTSLSDVDGMEPLILGVSALVALQAQQYRDSESPSHKRFRSLFTKKEEKNSVMEEDTEMSFPILQSLQKKNTAKQTNTVQEVLAEHLKKEAIIKLILEYRDN
jgi:hypothetical protein